MLVTRHSDSMHINALLFLVVCASFIVQVGDKSWGEGGGEKKDTFLNIVAVVVSSCKTIF